MLLTRPRVAALGGCLLCLSAWARGMRLVRVQRGGHLRSSAAAVVAAVLAGVMMLVAAYAAVRLSFLLRRAWRRVVLVRFLALWAVMCRATTQSGSYNC